MTTVLSVNGQLQSIFNAAQGERSQGYEEVKPGIPLSVQVLRAVVNNAYDQTNDRNNRLVLYTQRKEPATLEAGPELINFHARKEINDSDVLNLNFMGGDFYGNRMVYYTPSYSKEPIHLSTTLMELDGGDSDVIDAINSGLTELAGLPLFTPFLPYFGAARALTGLVDSLRKMFSRNDLLINHDVSLHFNEAGMPQLQSGRYLCLPDNVDESSVLETGHKLTASHHLQNPDGSPYMGSNYLVIQVNAVELARYKNFKVAEQAAILEQIRRKNSHGVAAIKAAVEIAKAGNDLDLIKKLGTEVKKDEPDSETINALLNGMSDDVKNVVKSLAKEEEDGGS